MTWAIDSFGRRIKGDTVWAILWDQDSYPDGMILEPPATGNLPQHSSSFTERLATACAGRYSG